MTELPTPNQKPSLAEVTVRSQVFNDCSTCKDSWPLLADPAEAIVCQYSSATFVEYRKGSVAIQSRFIDLKMMFGAILRCDGITC